MVVPSMLRLSGCEATDIARLRSRKIERSGPNGPIAPILARGFLLGHLATAMRCGLPLIDVGGAGESRKSTCSRRRIPDRRVR